MPPTTLATVNDTAIFAVVFVAFPILGAMVFFWWRRQYGVGIRSRAKARPSDFDPSVIIIAGSDMHRPHRHAEHEPPAQAGSDPPATFPSHHHHHTSDHHAPDASSNDGGTSGSADGGAGGDGGGGGGGGGD
jgi:uncharacterized membrane protein YgcG